MALNWTAKTPAESIRYTWSPPLAEDDGLADYDVNVSGATVDASSAIGNDIEVYVSGGVAGTTAVFEFHASTTNGEELYETVYLPIVTSAADGADAADIIDFALRPIVGIGGTASSNEKTDALEWLNDMLAEMGISGADVGAPFPLTLATVIYAPREWMSGIKNNLRVRVAEQYGRQVSPDTRLAANRGLQAIKTARLTTEEAGYY